MSKYSEKDAAHDTGVSTKEVERAWHDAREDAMAEGYLPERLARKQKQEAQKKERLRVIVKDPSKGKP
ncbi:MAG: hypothetical protein E2O79_06220 [Caldithrix sp.]|nr:MAG: hypothetical protein E2O79_06220 [Caldithrix sp.]